MSNEYIAIEAVVLATSEKAVLVGLKDQLPLMQVWIPKSVCDGGGEELDVDDEDIRVQEWWLEKEGLL